MDIYSSDKAVSYVYICTHKETGKFYIGYRMANVELNIPSHLDLPEYKTSSTTVRPDFHDYTWTIVAEFFDPGHAYTFEQQLIFDSWENPLLLNGHYNLGKNQFRTSGTPSDEHRKKMSDAKKGKPSGKKGKPISTEHRKKISDARKGKPGTTHSAETKQRISDAKKGNPSGRKGKTNSIEHRKKISDSNKGKTHSAETKQKISDSNKGKTHSAETKQKMSDAKKGKTHKLVTCPHCGLVGRGGNMTRYHFDNCSKKPI